MRLFLILREILKVLETLVSQYTGRGKLIHVDKIGKIILESNLDAYIKILKNMHILCSFLEHYAK